MSTKPPKGTSASRNSSSGVLIMSLSVTWVYVCSYHLYKSLLGKLFNAHYSVSLLYVGCVWQPPINEHDDDDDDDDDDE